MNMKMMMKPNNKSVSSKSMMIRQQKIRQHRSTPNNYLLQTNNLPHVLIIVSLFWSFIWIYCLEQVSTIITTSSSSTSTSTSTSNTNNIIWQQQEQQQRQRQTTTSRELRVAYNNKLETAATTTTTTTVDTTTNTTSTKKTNDRTSSSSRPFWCIDQPTKNPNETTYLGAVVYARIWPKTGDYANLTFDDLAHWMTYMRYAGVERVYLYDTHHSPEEQTLQHPAIESGVRSNFIQYIDWSHIELGNIDVKSGQRKRSHAFAVQTTAYDDVQARAVNVTRWLTFTDMDEYLFSPNDMEAGFLSRFLQIDDPIKTKTTKENENENENNSNLYNTMKKYLSKLFGFVVVDDDGGERDSFFEDSTTTTITTSSSSKLLWPKSNTSQWLVRNILAQGGRDPALGPTLIQQVPRIGLSKASHHSKQIVFLQATMKHGVHQSVLQQGQISNTPAYNQLQMRHFIGGRNYNWKTIQQMKNEKQRQKLIDTTKPNDMSYVAKQILKCF